MALATQQLSKQLLEYEKQVKQLFPSMINKWLNGAVYIYAPRTSGFRVFTFKPGTLHVHVGQRGLSSQPILSPLFQTGSRSDQDLSSERKTWRKKKNNKKTAKANCKRLIVKPITEPIVNGYFENENDRALLVCYVQTVEN